MIGAFLTRAITMLVGYIYPAYECFKTVEQRRPNLEILRFWCQYWIIISLLTVVERFGDALISWVPMYGEAKLAFIVYLWYPKTKGTTYIYYSFLRPYLTSHESEIDQQLSELRTRALDFLIQYWQKGSSFLHLKFIEILQYIAAQSNRPGRRQQAPPQNHPPPPPPPPPPPSPPPPPPPATFQGPPPAAFLGPPPAGELRGPPPAAFHSPPGPSGYDPSAPPAPPANFRPPAAEGNYRPGFYPSPMAFQPAPQTNQHRPTLEEIELDDIDEDDFIIPAANPPAVASSTSSSRYMTRSRQRATSNSNRRW